MDETTPASCCGCRSRSKGPYPPPPRVCPEHLRLEAGGTIQSGHQIAIELPLHDHHGDREQLIASSSAGFNAPASKSASDGIGKARHHIMKAMRETESTQRGRVPALMRVRPRKRDTSQLPNNEPSPAPVWLRFRVAGQEPWRVSWLAGVRTAPRCMP